MNDEKTMVFRNRGILDLEEAERERRVVSETFMDTVHREVASWQNKVQSVKIAINGDDDFPISNIMGNRMELLYYGKTSDPRQFSMVFEWAEAYMARPTTEVKYVYKDPVLGVVFMLTRSGSCYINLTHDIWGRKNPEVWIGTASSENSFESMSHLYFHCIGKGRDPFHVTCQRAYKIEGTIEDQIVLPGQTKPSIILLNAGICFMI